MNQPIDFSRVPCAVRLKPEFFIYIFMEVSIFLKERFLIEPLQFYNSYVTNNYAKNKSAKYVMMKDGVS